MLTINERFARVIKSLGMTTHEAAEALGMTDGYVRKLSSPGQSFGIEPFKAVLAALPTISPLYLLFGIGRMFSEHTGNQHKAAISSARGTAGVASAVLVGALAAAPRSWLGLAGGYSAASCLPGGRAGLSVKDADSEPYLKEAAPAPEEEQSVTPVQPAPAGVPRYDSFAQGCDRLLGRSDREAAERISVPGLDDCAAWLPVGDNAMAPRYAKGDLIAVRPLDLARPLPPGPTPCLVLTKPALGLRGLRLVSPAPDAPGSVDLTVGNAAEGARLRLDDLQALLEVRALLRKEKK